MNGNTIDLIERRLDIAIAKSEFKRIKLFIAALFLGLLIMFFDFFVVEDTTSFFRNENTKFFVMFWFSAFLSYEIIGFFIARNYLRKKEIVPEFMKIGNVIIEATFPGILIFILCYIEQSVIFLDSPLLFFYFILIIVSALNLEIKLGLITGLISAGGYLFVTVWAINAFDAANEILHFPPILYVARSFFMLIAALSSVFVAKEIKSRELQSSKLISQKIEIESLFGQQVSKKVAETLLADNYTNKKREVSILFMDIRNFSTFAEHHDPNEVIEFQNRFFGPIIRIIDNYNGITNQIFGDGLMATFGAPMKDKNHVENALKAGLEIISRVEQLSSSKVIPKTRIGIGLHTGKVVMGNIGNEMRRQFSITGTAVIIASRIEQLNKKYGTQFLISQEFLDQLDQKAYSFELIDELKVKNIDHLIRVYKVA
ncbi:MAG TPA: adenylate/guanylate cyclase domain-containing protein [Cyclobacteriaceae bacterium]